VSDPWRQELRDFVVVAVYVVLAGPILGLLWSAAGPKLNLAGAIAGTGVDWKTEICADVHLGLLGIGAGALCAAVAFALHRDGPGSVVGLAVGGLGASFVADRIGFLLNRGDTLDLLHAHHLSPSNLTIDPFFKVRALGVVVAWPIAALVVHMTALALRDRSRSLR
jgi:hypothetical protein